MNIPGRLAFDAVKSDGEYPGRMRTNVKRIWRVCLVILCLMIPAVVRADMEAPIFPHKIVSADGKYAFIILCGRDKGYAEWLFHTPYPESGLYLNDGSTTPLWTVDWCAYSWLPSDGIHVIRDGGWSRTHEGYSQEAFTIFAGGKPVKTFRVSDLVSLPFLLPHTSDHFKWRRSLTEEEGGTSQKIQITDTYDHYRQIGIDDEAHTMKVATLHGDQYVIDLNTGAIVSARRPVRTAFLILLIVFLPGYLIYLVRSSKERPLPFLQAIRGMCLKALFAAWVVVLFGFAYTCIYPHLDKDDLKPDIIATAVLMGTHCLPETMLNTAGWNGVNNILGIDEEALGYEYELGRELLWRGVEDPLKAFLASLVRLAFWFIPFAAAGLLNQSFLFFAKRIRRRASAPVNEREFTESDPSLDDEAPPVFSDVQRIESIVLYVLAYTLSAAIAEYVCSDIYYSVNMKEVQRVLATGGIELILILSVPVLILLNRLVVTVRDGEVVVRHRPFWFWKKRIAVGEIERCELWQKAGVATGRFRPFQRQGVLIHLHSGRALRIPSRRADELLHSIRALIERKVSL